MKSLWIVQHAVHEHPGVVGRLLRESGRPFEVIRPFAGDSFPRIDQVAGLISLGGPMSSNDENAHPWIDPELQLICSVFKQRIPFLGICLGAQLACRAQGGKVTRLAAPEIGWHAVTKTTEGNRDPLIGRLPQEMTVYQWHYESFELFGGTEHLLESPGCRNQAWKFGDHAYGVQFHPEVDSLLLEEWLEAEGSEQELQRARADFGAQAVQLDGEQRLLAGRAAASNRRMAEALITLFLR